MKQVIKIPSLGDAENTEVIEDAELIEETTDVISPVKDPTIKVESSNKNSETTEPPKKEK